MMKRFMVLAALSLISALAFCQTPNQITINGAGVDPTSLIQFLGNHGMSSSSGITATGNASLKVSNVPLGPIALASIGTNTTDVAGQLWVTDLYVPTTRTIGTVGFLQGGTATTDNCLVAVYGQYGNLLGNSALTGVVLSGANTFQEQALLLPVALTGPGTYYVAVQCNGTASGAIQTVPSPYITVRTGTVSGAFGTLPATITGPTSFTAAKAPVVYVY